LSWATGWISGTRPMASAVGPSIFFARKIMSSACARPTVPHRVARRLCPVRNPQRVRACPAPLRKRSPRRAEGRRRSRPWPARRPGA
jgi:hypothetical protein